MQELQRTNPWKATTLLAGGNAVALGLSFLTSILVARQFGTTWEMDAYTLAVSIPESLQYVLMLATLSVIFTPLFIDFRTRYGEQEAWEIALSLLIMVCVAIALLLPVLAFGAPAIVGILAPGFPMATRDLAAQLLIWILPTLFYYGTAGLLLGICFAYHDFRIAALNTVLISLLNLLSLFLFVGLLGWGVRGLVIGRVASLLILEGFLLWGSFRFKRHLTVRVRFNHPQLRFVASFLPAYLVGALSGQLSLAINRSFASTLGAGSMAAWGYGQRIADIPLAIFGGALGTAFLPGFAMSVSENQRQAASIAWTRIIIQLSIILMPVAGILIVLNVPLTSILFERGSFDRTSTQLTAMVLAGLALGLPTRAVGGLIARGLPAFKTRSVPALLSVISTGANIVFNVALVGVLGLFGIALAASLADSLFMVVGVIFFVRWLGAVPVRQLAKQLTKILIAATGMGLLSFMVATASWYPPLDSKTVSLLLKLGISLAVALLSYGLLVYVLRVEESRSALNVALRHVARWTEPEIR